ncbi:STE20/SPS1-related proline-alanine-rich protein kinase isoform X2 [Amborella trichopoda]|nr:STE20/SPS1-related proline-alanine-rich protein kinase isoform X2 [Amborella trichopoda]|eukprot:XP_011625173.1 STE20/SPS1-related proline-alanine-rich protein kinase isoform X2 [Amborella trichopoda]
MGRMGGQKSYSALPGDYKLLEEVGHGASAVVYRAIYLPFNEVVAVKCLDLDRCGSNLDDIRREAQTMSLIDHPNVIRAYSSFVVDHSLWVVMPFMAEGSCLHLMKIAYPEGFEEAVIGSVLKETLKAVEYLHRHGHIHRDVKAGNILLDSDGGVKLADFGVTACMFDRGDRQRSRNTFVGTPCWMAPEVLQPGSGYNFKADIWSFGITALELAHGHAPFSKYPPMKVLLMTIQSAPPGLDYDRDKRFSKSFKEMVAMCLVKDPMKRPTAEKLLKHSFFKHAKPPEATVPGLLVNLPPLWERVKALQLKDAAQLALKKMPSAEEEALSQDEYKRGVSAWNFDVEDLKSQAALVQDDDDPSVLKEEDEDLGPLVNDRVFSVSKSGAGKSISTNDLYCKGNIDGAGCLDSRCFGAREENSESESPAAENLEQRDGRENGSINDPIHSLSKRDPEQSNSRNQLFKHRQTHSGPLMPIRVLSMPSSERGRFSERDEGDYPSAMERGCKHDGRKEPNLSGPLMLPSRASANSLSAPIRSSGFREGLDDKTKANVIQIKGRFSITSENADRVKDIPLCSVSRRSSQGSPLRKSASVGDWLVDTKQTRPKEASNLPIPVSVLIPQLQNLFQQTIFQQDLVANLLRTVQQTELVEGGKWAPPTQSLGSDSSNDPAVSERERLLSVKVAELQNRMINLTDELTAAKLKHVQLQQQLTEAHGREEDRIRKEEKEYS